MIAENRSMAKQGTQDAPPDRVRLSVVIACYNAEDTIGEELEALAGQQWPYPWEVVVANNRCTDGSMRVVESFRARIPRLRIVDAFDKQGTAYAMNAGVRAARGDLIVFCDADDVVGDGWVAAMAEALAEHDFVSGPHEVERLNKTELGGNRVNAQVTGVQEYDDPPYLPHAGAGNLGIRRAVFERVGGFDESMPHLFDTDFCWRVQLAGYRLAPAPKAILHVRHRHTVSGIYRQARNYGEYNVFIYKRYRPHGMPRYPWKRSVRSWIDLGRSVGGLFDPGRRAKWIWELGWRLGRLKGCLKYRTMAF
jgi:GT2 family glycosyltransferase